MGRPKCIEARQVRPIRTFPSLWDKMKVVAKSIGLNANAFAEKAIIEKIEQIENQTRINKE